MSLEIKKYNTIQEVPIDHWNQLAPKEYIGLETQHLDAIEKSGINKINPYYLIATKKNEAIGICHFFPLELDLSALSSDISQENRKALKFWDPSFMNMKMIECGIISGVGKALTAKEELMPSFLSTTAKEMEKAGKTEGVDFILIRDIPFDDYNKYKTLEKKGFVPILGFPTTGIDVKWDNLDDYISSLKNKTRRNLKRRLRMLDKEEIETSVIQDFGQYSQRLEYLWKQTNLNASDYEHETLNAAYFKEINNRLDSKSEIVAIKRNNEIVAFVLCLEGEKEYFPIHAGVDYKYNKEYSLYFNLPLLAIKNGIQKKKEHINFGITTYDYKLLLGCELKPLLYFIKYLTHPNLTPALAQLFRDSIKQPENFHRPFSKQKIEKRIQLQDVYKKLDKIRKDKTDVFCNMHNYVRTDIMKVANIYSFFPAFESAQEAEIQYKGKSVIMLGTNCYLGLATHPEVKQAAKDAIDKYGTGCSGSPIMNGTLDIHEELRESLAKFMKKEDSMLFSTGYQTNLGVISTIAGRNDVIIMDDLNHASLIDGAQLALARVIRYKHNDMKDLEKALNRFPKKGKLVVVDAVFSMEGNIVNLPEVVRLCRKYKARIMLDEAHGLGVLGEGGRGAAEHFGLLDEMDIIMGTFSKSLASIGGFVVADKKLIDSMRHVARSHLFSASLPPALTASVKKALEILQREPERRLKVLENARFMAEGLQNLGYNTSYKGTAIVPVLCGSEVMTFSLFKKLLEEGVFVNPVIYPAVAKGEEVLRTSYMATHTRPMLEKALSIFKKVRTPTYPKIF